MDAINLNVGSIPEVMNHGLTDKTLRALSITHLHHMSSPVMWTSTGMLFYVPDASMLGPLIHAMESNGPRGVFQQYEAIPNQPLLVTISSVNARRPLQRLVMESRVHHRVSQSNGFCNAIPRIFASGYDPTTKAFYKIMGSPFKAAPKPISYYVEQRALSKVLYRSIEIAFYNIWRSGVHIQSQAHESVVCSPAHACIVDFFNSVRIEPDMYKHIMRGRAATPTARGCILPPQTSGNGSFVADVWRAYNHIRNVRTKGNADYILIESLHPHIKQYVQPSKRISATKIPSVHGKVMQAVHGAVKKSSKVSLRGIKFIKSNGKWHQRHRSSRSAWTRRPSVGVIPEEVQYEPMHPSVSWASASPPTINMKNGMLNERRNANNRNNDVNNIKDLPRPASTEALNFLKRTARANVAGNNPSFVINTINGNPNLKEKLKKIRASIEKNAQSNAQNKLNAFIKIKNPNHIVSNESRRAYMESYVHNAILKSIQNYINNKPPGASLNLDAVMNYLHARHSRSQKNNTSNNNNAASFYSATSSPINTNNARSTGKGIGKSWFNAFVPGQKMKKT